MIAVLPAREWVSMDDVVLGTPADLPGLLERVVVPVVRTLFPDESIDGIALAWEGDPPSRGRSDLLLTLTVEAETFRWIALTQETLPEPDVAARSRLASDLQDFIAESGFARGQLRTHPF
jgi:hypothetical protein